MSSPVSTHFRHSESGPPPAWAEPIGARAAIVAHAAITKTDLAVNLIIVDLSLSERPLPYENVFRISAQPAVISSSSNILRILHSERMR
jgi:hypothetical protein